MAPGVAPGLVPGMAPEAAVPGREAGAAGRGDGVAVVPAGADAGRAFETGAGVAAFGRDAACSGGSRWCAEYCTTCGGCGALWASRASAWRCCGDSFW